MQQLTEQQAIDLYKSGCWQEWTDDEVVRFQLFQDRLCLPFGRFHEAIEKLLGRPVYTHEFAFRDQLIDEFQKERKTPTFQEIMDLIPAEKRIVIDLSGQDDSSMQGD